ncbi:hypothetical protein L6452_08473 [Arctium lappa]|uniref:Uncharacterized protein n=1 Tax=Arctium lappa TaxID=4217 RepID=A0ACB9DHD9_ARCLA|nr:hypothetical protein L6452_08473 [Arctium lappa]
MVFNTPLCEQKGTWQGFRKNSSEEKDLMFKVERTTNTLTRLEFQVFLTNGYGNPNNESDFKMRGSPFYRSCTIYNGNSIVAQATCILHSVCGRMEFHFWIARGPGSGKGTKSPIIKDEYCLCHLTTGDMLRAVVVAKTPLGIKAKEAMDNLLLATKDGFLSEEDEEQDDLCLSMPRVLVGIS